MKTQVLCLNAYHGGSHRAFLEAWHRRSQHDFTTLALPGYKWKWRMRHAAATFARQVQELAARGQNWDVVFCTDMLNAAEWRGLAPARVQSLPLVIYFHENQLTYPDRQLAERDLHFAFTNILSAAAADRVWFNSRFHRNQFLDAARALLARMPDHAPTHLIEKVAATSEVHSPGIEPIAPPAVRPEGPLRIGWAARWEHDKGPDAFFAALYKLLADGVDFRIRVLGQSYGTVPACFAAAQQWLAGRIDHWGYLPDREAYRACLAACDVVVSTAIHEFFGIAVLEAASAGCFPLVPRKLAYPETFRGQEDFFYDGSVGVLTERLRELAAPSSIEEVWRRRHRTAESTKRYDWSKVAAELDEAIMEVSKSERKR